MKHRRPIFSRFMLGAIPAIGLVAVLPVRSRPPPDVVLIVVDTLRHDRLSQYGYQRDTSPALAWFAQQSTRYETVYAPSSWTVPSTASILTGQSPARHGAIAVGDVLKPEVVTLAELLAKQGYQTAGFSYNVHVGRKTGFDQGFHSFVDFRGGATAYPDISKMISLASEFFADVGPEPLFLYLHPMNAHGPYKVPEAHRTKLIGHRPDRSFRYRDKTMAGIMRKGQANLRKSVFKRYLESLDEQYDTAVRYSTDTLAKVLDMLEERGRYDNALIILTSDHGEELFEHGGFSHGYSLYEEVVRTPLLLKMPGQDEARVVKRPVSVLDIYPTIREVLGLPKDPRHIEDGRSLLAAEETETPRPFIFHVAGWETRAVARGIRLGSYKLIHTQQNYEGLRDHIALYRLDQDPKEQHNLAGEQPLVVQKLRALLDRTWDDRAANAAAADNVLDELDEESLRALGYVE